MKIWDGIELLCICVLRLMEVHMEIAELLITKDADVDAKEDIYGRTPLYYPAWKGHKEIAELLIAEGADVNAKDGDEDRTPLHNGGSGRPNKEVAELLITEGADVNAKRDNGDNTAR